MIIYNSMSKETLSFLGKFENSQQISQHGDLLKGLRMPREFEFQWDLITDIPQDWGSKLSESTTKLYMYQDSGERSSDATRD